MSFVWYDTETTGASTKYDQVLQFAAARTGDDLDAVREDALETFEIRGRRLPHIIPHPMALMVTGIDPVSLDREPLTNFEMAGRIHQKLSSWSPSTFIGYNTLKFDERVLRQLFWTNLLDPYVTSSKDCLRADLFPIVRVAHAIDPTVLEAPRDEASGWYSYKLDRLAPMNGFTAHNAHDALGDVKATIHLASIVRTRAPRVWSHMLANADAARVLSILELGEAVLLTFHPRAARRRVARLAVHPEIRKQVLVFDLGRDPGPYLAMTPEQLADALEARDPALQIVKANEQPAIFMVDDPLVRQPLALRAQDPQEEPFPTTEVAHQRIAMLHADPQMRRRCEKALEIRSQRFKAASAGAHIEERLYDGFTSWNDKKRLLDFHHAATWAERYAIVRTIESEPLRHFGLRLVYFNEPDALPPVMRDRFGKALITTRILAEGKHPWTTLPAALAALREPPFSELTDPAKQASAGWIGQWLRGLDVRLRDELATIERRLGATPAPAPVVTPAA